MRVIYMKYILLYNKITVVVLSAMLSLSAVSVSYTHLISIVIDDPNDQTCHELVETLRNCDMSVRRALQKYSVSVYIDVYKRQGQCSP